MAAVDVQDRLADELMSEGADPAEAGRLAALAGLISRTEIAIDAGFAADLEDVLLRDEPEEHLATVIALRRGTQAAGPALLPVAGRGMRPTRWAQIVSVAAAILLFIGVGLTAIMGGGDEPAKAPEAIRSPLPAPAPEIVPPPVEQPPPHVETDTTAPRVKQVAPAAPKPRTNPKPTKPTKPKPRADEAQASGCSVTASRPALGSCQFTVSDAMPGTRS